MENKPKTTASKFLLWGGFAAMMIGLASCGLSCIGHFDNTGSLTDTQLQDYASTGVNMFALGFGAVIVGAILKAFGK